MASNGVSEVPIFVDTSLGTHIAMSISPDITAGDFKRKLESTHSNCVPQMGNIRVNGLMVKRKSHFYHLPKSLPLKHAFQGLKRTWFIYIEANPCSSSTKPVSPNYPAEEVGKCISKKRKNCTKLKRKKRRVKGFHRLKAVTKMVFAAVHLSRKRKSRTRKLVKSCFLNYTAREVEKGFPEIKENDHKQESVFPLVGKHSEILSESISVSVSGIIKKYFSAYDEVTSTSTSESKFEPCRNRPLEPFKSRTDRNCSYAPKTPPTMLSIPLREYPTSRSSEDKIKMKTGVGERLVLASNNLGVSATKRKPMISVCRFKESKQSVLKSSSLVRNLVFEMSDEED